VITDIFDIQTTSLTINWSLGDPRPGTVTYTITLIPDQGAETKSYIVQGISLYIPCPHFMYTCPIQIQAFQMQYTSLEMTMTCYRIPI